MNEEVSLREATATDVPVLYNQQLEPAGNQMAAWTPRDREGFDSHWEKTAADPAVVRRTILFGERVAGQVASFERDGRREVCYWLGQDFWNKGIATKALSAFLELEKRRPLWAGVAKRNAASIRVLEKCGFVLAGEETYSNRAGEKVEGLILKLA